MAGSDLFARRLVPRLDPAASQRVAVAEGVEFDSHGADERSCPRHFTQRARDALPNRAEVGNDLWTLPSMLQDRGGT